MLMLVVAFASLTAVTAVTVVCTDFSPLVVNYPTFDGKLARVSCGNPLSLSGTAKEPSVQWLAASQHERYTLMLVDPDAPGLQYYVHWLAGNIEGNDLLEGTRLNGNAIEDYFGPVPPTGSGVHRYIFYLFQQPHGYLDFRRLETRSHFDLYRFQTKHNLGKPVAVNYFLASAELADY